MVAISFISFMNKSDLQASLCAHLPKRAALQEVDMAGHQRTVGIPLRAPVSNLPASHVTQNIMELLVSHIVCHTLIESSMCVVWKKYSYQPTHKVLSFILLY